MRMARYIDVRANLYVGYVMGSDKVIKIFELFNVRRSAKKYRRSVVGYRLSADGYRAEYIMKSCDRYEEMPHYSDSDYGVSGSDGTVRVSAGECL